MKGRFAPSPSGEMHLGNALSALLAWLSVRSQGGSMVLRMEDLDPDRCRRSYCAGVAEDLRWLGLDWDEEGYYQSERGALYREALDQLQKQDLLYPCFCTRGQLHAASAPHNQDGEPVYPGTCRTLTPARRAELARTRKPALRIRVPEDRVDFLDQVYGLCSQRLDLECGDFILRRSDGVFAYQLAVVVDDAQMGITEVVRGRDLLSSTPRQICLQRLLGYPTPSYAHNPQLVTREGRRLSKREADLSLAALRARGVSPEEIVGRLAYAVRLADTPEPVTARELVSSFDWDRVRPHDIPVSWDGA